MNRSIGVRGADWRIADWPDHDLPIVSMPSRDRSAAAVSDRRSTDPRTVAASAAAMTAPARFSSRNTTLLVSRDRLVGWSERYRG